MVGAVRSEPTASASRTLRSATLSHIPLVCADSALYDHCSTGLPPAQAEKRRVRKKSRPVTVVVSITAQIVTAGGTMPFVKYPGVPGLVYVPEEEPGTRKNHNCPDCKQCGMCSDSRCRPCRKRCAGGPDERPDLSR